MTTRNSFTTDLPNGPGRSYTPASVAAISALFHNIPELSPGMQKTAARAILQFRMIFENPCETTKDGCLDKMYVELHGLGESHGVEAKEIQQLENETLSDLLDAVCFQTSLFLPTITTPFFLRRYQLLSASMEEYPSIFTVLAFMRQRTLQ